MASSISIGTTGLSASSKQMDVIANNLANSNTLGYKAGTTYFASMLNQSLSSSGSMAVGQGVAVAAVQTIFSQGSFENTGSATDLAIDGDGFFMMKNLEGALYYTRAGAFHINEHGYLVDGNDYRVQGYNSFNASNSVSTDVDEDQTDISLKNVQSAPKATTEVSIGANLDETAPAGEKFNISQSVFDSKGTLHTLSITFMKTEGNGQWGFDVRLDGDMASDTSMQAASGVKFDGNGTMIEMYHSELDNTAATAAGTGTIDNAETQISRPGQLYKDATGIVVTKGAAAGVWTVTTPAGYDNAIAWQETVGGKEYMKIDLDGKGGSDIVFTLNDVWAAGDTVQFDVVKTEVTSQDLNLAFGPLPNEATIGVTEGTGANLKNIIVWDLVGNETSKISGYSSTSVIKSLSNNGYTSGILKGLSVGNNGVIRGSFTNGQTSELGQLILADFPNTNGLKKIGNYFAQTSESREAIKNKPGSGGLGEVMSHSLEMSNTDVAKEFINMITAQRAYQASSRIITTADQMLTELMNIKR